MISRSLATLALAVLLACTGGPEGGQSHSGGESHDGGTAVIAYSVDMMSVNEVITRNTALHTALHYYILFMPLLEEQADYRQGPPSWKPRLAESYSFSDDRLALTFALREDAVWSDGEPITAEDVRFTWQAQTDPDIAWEVAEDKEAIADVEVVDDHTVVFHFDHAYANQLIDAVQGVILPAHAWGELPFAQWREKPEWFFDNLVTSGPYLLERWEPQERIVLVRNPRALADERPPIGRVVFRIVPEEETQAAQLRAGEVNLIEPSPTKAEQLKTIEGIEVLSYPHRQIVFITWNLERPMLADAATRRALTMAIDRQEIIDSLYYGYANPAASPYMIDAWVYNRELEPHPYDPAAARALLAEAGWADGDGDGVLERGGEPFRLELLSNSDNRIRMSILELAQSQLARVGVEAVPVGLEFNTLLARGYAQDFDGLVMGLGIDTSFDLTGLFHSSAIGEGLNWGAYADDEADRLMDEIKTYVEPLEAKPRYDRLQAVLHRDQPISILYQPERMVAIRGLRNVRPTALSPYINIREWELTER